MENRIDITVTDEMRQAVLSAISGVKTLMPFLVKLSEADRESLQKLSDGRKPFTEKAFELSSNHDSIDPGRGMVTMATADYGLFSFLSTVETELLHVVEMVRDTKQLAGSEAYTVALFIYSKAKMALRMGEPGMQTIVDELGELFKQNQSTVPNTPAV